MAIDYDAFLDRVVRAVPFVLKASYCEEAFGVIVRLKLQGGVNFQHAFPRYFFNQPSEFIDTLLDELAYAVHLQVSKALEKEWQSSSDSSLWKGILRHDGFEKMVHLANPLPLIRYAIPESMPDRIFKEYDEDVMMPINPQRTIDFYLQETNPQTRVAYYSSQR